MTGSSPTNPYESPREAAPRVVPRDFSDDSAELADLRRRVGELERRVGKSWVVHPNFFLRVFGIFGYFLVGYALCIAVVAAVMGLVELIEYLGKR